MKGKEDLQGHKEVAFNYNARWSRDESTLDGCYSVIFDQDQEANIYRRGSLEEALCERQECDFVGLSQSSSQQGRVW